MSGGEGKEGTASLIVGLLQICIWGPVGESAPEINQVSDLNQMSDLKVHMFAVSASTGEGKQHHARQGCHLL